MIIFSIPFEVPSQNVCERRHWSARRKEQETLAILLRIHCPPFKRVTAQRLVSIRAYRKRKCRDLANLIGGCKGLVDALVTAGLLVDDSEKWARFEYAQDLASVLKHKTPMTGITISEGKW